MRKLLKAVRVITFILVVVAFGFNIAMAWNNNNFSALFGWTQALIWFVFYVVNDSSNDRFIKMYQNLVKEMQEIELAMMDSLEKFKVKLDQEIAHSTELQKQLDAKPVVTQSEPAKVEVIVEPKKRGRKPKTMHELTGR